MASSTKTMIAALMMVCGASAQSQPAIRQAGTSLEVTTPLGGTLFVNGEGVGAASDVAAVSTIVDSVSNMQASTGAQTAASVTAMQACTAIGKVYDSTGAGSCIFPMSDPTLYATAGRMTAAEQGITAIQAEVIRLANLTGVILDNLCHTCPDMQYAAVPCQGNTPTQCQDCPAETYSRGGFQEQCIRCASELEGCQNATCTSATNAVCTMCRPDAQDGQAYVLNQTSGTCYLCPAGTYKSGPSTCSVCGKNSSCAVASCQVNGNGLQRLAGQGSFSSIYAPWLNSRTIDDINSRWGDGVYSFGNFQPHSGTSTADRNNPWVQVDLGQYTQLTGIQNIMFWNRQGRWGCRTLGQNNGGICNAVLGNVGRQWTGANEGAIFGVSDSPLNLAQTSTTSYSWPTTMCSSSVQTNCVCGRMTTYNNTNGGRGPTTISCSGARGRYVYMGLPGVNRMLNFAELEIWGTYAAGSPQISTCVTGCSTPGCQDGMATCTGDLSTAQCPANGCIDTVSSNRALVPNNGQCTLCATNQYRPSLTATGSCANCPCSGTCQANTVIDLSQQTPTQGPGTYSSRYTAAMAIDNQASTFTHTANTNNPMWQIPLGGMYNVASVTITNRPGRCGSRLFTGTGCAWGPPGTSTTDYNGAAQGAMIRVANSSCTAGTATCPGTTCKYLVRPSTLTMVVTCDQVVRGSYLSIQLPGRRILQLTEVVVNVDTTQPAC